MKTVRFFPILILIFLAYSCSKDLVISEPGQITGNENTLKSASPHMKIAVMSDIHYLAPSLLPAGAAEGVPFQTYLAYDPKLIEFSVPIFMKAVEEIVASKPDILLIPGDMTKDGELLSHQEMIFMLNEISKKGIKVFVVPGNHDVNNPEAMSYTATSVSPAPTISATEFAEMYADFGYGKAISRDTHSLSYVCQPFNNIWILGIDACKYDQNVTIATVSGAIRAGTMTWIKERLAEAKKKNITVYAMMHHGLVEHYEGQSMLDPGYVVDNWETAADELIDAGLRILFTGHNHANDIAMRVKDENVLYDIETGSLVTPPSPYRIIRTDPNAMYVDTKHITSIDVPFPPGMDFITYSDMFLSAHMDLIFGHMFSNPPYNVPSPYLEQIVPLFREAFMAHYAGDEQITPEIMQQVAAVGGLNPTLGWALGSLWTDLSPADGQLTIDMRKKLK